MTPEFVFILIVWALLGWVVLASGWDTARKYVMYDKGNPTLKQLGRMLLVQLACGPLVWLMFFIIACNVLFGWVRHDWRLYRARQLIAGNKAMHYWLHKQVQQVTQEQRMEHQPPLQFFSTVSAEIPDDLRPLWDAAAKCAAHPEAENMAEFQTLCRPGGVLLGLQAIMYVHLIGKAQQIIEGEKASSGVATGKPGGIPPCVQD